RAGRRHGAALAVLVASAAPLDQFLMKHPEYLRARSPEQALINPDNPLILLHHLRCAAFEMAFTRGEHFGSLDAGMLKEYLAFLTESGDLHDSGERFFWMADAYPAAQISLRSTSAQPVVLQVETDDRLLTIGTVDQESAYWLVHPQAIYLHEGQTFEVESLDLETNIARLKPVESDFYTEPQREVTVDKIQTIAEEPVCGAKKSWGDILVTTQTTGYRRIRWFTHEVLGAGPVDLPPTQLRTTGYWLTISSDTIEKLRAENAWNSDPNNYGPNWVVQRIRARERDNFTCQLCGTPEAGRSHHVHHKTPFRQFTSYLAANQLENLITLCPSCHRRVETAVRIRTGLSGLSYTLNNLAPLFLMCDGEDLGGHAEMECAFEEGAPAVIIYDRVPAGIGLSENLYRIHAELIARAYELVSECDCKEGCPSCVGPAGENGYGGKEETLALLAVLNGKPYTRSQNGESEGSHGGIALG
ncbi:MAG TPA: Zn-binding domain-containing protein, partial [Anaerolineaceae bacterium]